MSIKQIVITMLIGVVSFWTNPVLSHGRLWEPPGRSTMWRHGYSTPINYQDNELYCGGLAHQLSQGYKCGVCGDPYDSRRENEANGKYATGIVTRTYRQGQRVTFQVDLTANHKGYFEFKICPTNNPKVKETQNCFDRYPLSLANGAGTKYFIPHQSAMMSVDLVLPSNLVCDFCVLQWRYHAGNNWGTDPNGRSCVGCGPQEEFYGCADIKILPAGFSHSLGRQQDSPLSDTPAGTSRKTENNNQENPGSIGTNHLEPHSSTGRGSLSNSSSANRIIASSGISSTTQSRVELSTTHVASSTTLSQATLGNAKEKAFTSSNSKDNNNSVLPDINGDVMICRGIGGQTGLDQWCQQNCQMGFCPQTHCTCSTAQYVHSIERPPGCRASGAFDNVPGYDQWCVQNCAAGNCPSSICIC